jgi:hypothetical protein
MTPTEILNFICAMERTTCSQPATTETSSAPRMAKSYLTIALDALLVDLEKG